MTNVAPDARIAELTRELAELRGQKEAVADVLRALSGSGMRLQPILDQIVEAAARLGHADSCLVWLVDGELLRLRASFGAPESAVEHQRLHPHTAELGSCTGRVALTKRPVHIPDVDEDQDYTYDTTQRGHYKTLLGLPILLEGELVGVFGLSRREVRPFESDEIDLTSTFADQAAVAISTAGLFETVERQKAELTRFPLAGGRRLDLERGWRAASRRAPRLHHRGLLRPPRFYGLCRNGRAGGAHRRRSRVPRGGR
jgi:two-component system NtrC family sensor kinase